MSDSEPPRRNGPPMESTDRSARTPLRCLLTTDESRGQSTVVGTIILLGFVTIAFSIAQVSVAPQVQAEAEYEHASEVIQGAANVQSDTIEVATTGNLRSSTVQMGTEYPASVVLLHPPDPSGTILTEEPNPLLLRNSQAVREETADYVDGTTQDYEHKRLRYSPNYNEFRSAGDSTIEQGVLYQDYESSNRIVATPNLVNGNQISLIATTGNISHGGQQAKVVETVPLSASEETTLVEDDGDPIHITFESDLSVAEWEDILSSEIDPNTPPSSVNDKYIVDIRNSSGQIVIELEQGQVYELSTSKVGYKLGEQASFPESEQPEATYLTTSEPTEQTVQTNETVRVTVQARDSYNNPIANTVVDASADKGDASVVSPITRQDGIVTVVYEAPPSTSAGTDTVTIEFDDANEAKDRVEFEFEVTG